MTPTHRAATITFLATSCLFCLSCSEQETKENKKDPVREYIDTANNSIKTAKAIRSKKSLIGIRDILIQHTMTHGGKYPTRSEYTRLTRGMGEIAVYTGEGLTTSAGNRGVILYMEAAGKKDMFDVLLADSKLVTLTKPQLDERLKVSDELRAGVSSKG